MNIRSKSLSGMYWSAIERFSLQGIQFAIGVILARLLDPKDFGLLAMLNIFIGLAQIFTDCGLSSALIRHRAPKDIDFNTAFVASVCAAMVVMGFLFAFAPAISRFYHQPELVGVTRAMAFVVLFGALGSVHRTKLAIDVDFKTLALVSLVSAICSGLLGVYCAFHEFGVWSLVYQAIANALLTLIGLAVVMKYFPRIHFSAKSFREMFGFGANILGSSLLHALYSNLYTMVIGRNFSPGNLGLYARADSIGQLPSANITSILSRVTLPILSKVQGDSKKLNEVYEKYLVLAGMCVFPMMFGLCAIAGPLIDAVLGAKWNPSVIYLQILCFGLMLDPICSINLSLFYVKGRSDLTFKLEIVKKTIALSILFASIPFGLQAMCIGRSVYGFVALFLNIYFAKEFLGMSALQQLKKLLPYYLLGACMAALVLFLMECASVSWQKVVIGCVFGAVFYIASAIALNLSGIKYAFEILRK